jgi:hypothetical protein
MQVGIMMAQFAPAPAKTKPRLLIERSLIIVNEENIYGEVGGGKTSKCNTANRGRYKGVSADKNKLKAFQVSGRGCGIIAGDKDQ